CILKEFVDLKEPEYIIVALWILHTFKYDSFMITPRLFVTSPVRECGKSSLMVLIERLASRAEKMDGVTGAMLYRIIDERHCTILRDGGDNLELSVRALLRQVMNGGHARGGKIGRVINGAPRRFKTFCPMAIAAIGSVPLPLLSRSVVIRMERTTRALKELSPEVLDDPNSDLNVIYRQVFHWARIVELNLNPEMPAELRNRVRNNWKVLIAVADSFGPASGKAAREAAITFQRGYRDEDVGVTCLSHIHTIYHDTRAVQMASQQLVGYLNGMEDGDWSEWCGLRGDQQPRPLSQGQLALILRPFGIRPRSIWPPRRKADSKSRKGYFRWQFERAWRQYCAQDGTPAQGNNVRQLRK